MADDVQLQRIEQVIEVQFRSLRDHIDSAIHTERVERIHGDNSIEQHVEVLRSDVKDLRVADGKLQAGIEKAAHDLTSAAKSLRTDLDETLRERAGGNADRIEKAEARLTAVERTMADARASVRTILALGSLGGIGGIIGLLEILGWIGT